MKFLILPIFLLLFAITACEKRKDISLQDGFSIQRIYGNAHSLINPYGIVLILPNVANAVDDEDFLVGFRERVEPALKLSDYVKDQAYGYFIYEKKTQQLIMGLSLNEFLELTENKNIKLELESESMGSE